MDKVIDFLINNYVWFLVISLIIIFALIGYLVDLTNPRLRKQENKKLDNKASINEDIKPVKLIEPIGGETEEFKVHPSVASY